MERPSPYEKKGAIFIRTMFGEVSRHDFPALSITEMIENEQWRAAIRAEGGPFCYTDFERSIPF